MLMHTLWMLGGCAAALLVGIGAYIGRLRPGLVQLQLTFSQVAFCAVTRQWSADQLQRVRRHFVADYVLIALYSGFGWQLATAVPRLESAALVLTVAGLCDVIENVLHQQFLSPSPPSSSWPYRLAGVAASLKWLLIAVFGLMWLLVGIQNAV